MIIAAEWLHLSEALNEVLFLKTPSRTTSASPWLQTIFEFYSYLLTCKRDKFQYKYIASMEHMKFSRDI